MSQELPPDEEFFISPDFGVGDTSTYDGEHNTLPKHSYSRSFLVPESIPPPTDLSMRPNVPHQPPVPRQWQHPDSYGQPVAPYQLDYGSVQFSPDVSGANAIPFTNELMCPNPASTGYPNAMQNQRDSFGLAHSHQAMAVPAQMPSSQPVPSIDEPWTTQLLDEPQPDQSPEVGPQIQMNVPLRPCRSHRQTGPNPNTTSADFASAGTFLDDHEREPPDPTIDDLVKRVAPSLLLSSQLTGKPLDHVLDAFSRKLKLVLRSAARLSDKTTSTGFSWQNVESDEHEEAVKCQQLDSNTINTWFVSSSESCSDTDDNCEAGVSSHHNKEQIQALDSFALQRRTDKCKCSDRHSQSMSGDSSNKPKGRFPCLRLECDGLFHDEGAWERHVQQCVPKQLWLCPECNRPGHDHHITNRRDRMARHLFDKHRQQHTDMDQAKLAAARIKPYKPPFYARCPLCSQVSNDWREFFKGDVLEHFREENVDVTELKRKWNEISPYPPKFRPRRAGKRASGGPNRKYYDDSSDGDDDGGPAPDSGQPPPTKRRSGHGEKHNSFGQSSKRSRKSQGDDYHRGRTQGNNYSSGQSSGEMLSVDVMASCCPIRLEKEGSPDLPDRRKGLNGRLKDIATSAYGEGDLGPKHSRIYQSDDDADNGTAASDYEGLLRSIGEWTPLRDVAEHEALSKLAADQSSDGETHGSMSPVHLRPVPNRPSQPIDQSGDMEPPNSNDPVPVIETQPPPSPSISTPIQRQSLSATLCLLADDLEDLQHDRKLTAAKLNELASSLVQANESWLPKYAAVRSKSDRALDRSIKSNMKKKMVACKPVVRRMAMRTRVEFPGL